MSDGPPSLGTLEEIDPRTVWKGEATDFTPWLLEHGEHLAEVLGIDLELEHAEHPIGPFAVDLIGSDLSNGVTLIVENQLESTDHTHLGQLLTYAAGTEAATIVWLATRFRDEHRQALDWLNQITREDVHFFGIEIRVVRIGESQPAPLFEVVAQPNEWQKQARSASTGALSPRAALYLQFWEAYLARVRDEHPDWTRARIPQRVNWMSQPSPIPGTQINPCFVSKGRIRHELYIDTGDAEQNTALFEQFETQREAFEAAYGRALTFEPLPDRRACRIADYTTGDVTVTDQHGHYIAWFLDCGERLRAALSAIEIG